MSGPYRLPQGGRIDRGQTVQFSFSDQALTGFQGDTLASALLANGVRVAGRSFKYHRPRGVMAAGFDEPNILVQLHDGARSEPNLKATQVELFDGLRAAPVNAWPSARFDLLAVVQWLMPFMPAGFYYKTFMAPNWHWYEWFIRRAAGLGKGPRQEDPDRYDKRNRHCDVLIIGAGPAGLAAATRAAAGGARVMLIDNQPEAGGSLLAWPASIDGLDGIAWRDKQLAALGKRDNVQILLRTTATGYYDDNHVVAVQQLGDHLPPGAAGPRQRLWKLRAAQVVLATGAIERPLVFPNNDRPGVMLAGAAREYVCRYGVAPGRRIAIATNNDSAYEVAVDLAAAGVEIAAIVDARRIPAGAAVDRARSAGLPMLTGMAPTNAIGRAGVRQAEFHAIDEQGKARAGSKLKLEIDALLVSGGWSPTVHLFSQAGGSLRFDEAAQAFAPDQTSQALRCVGAAAGQFDFDQALKDAAAQGKAAAADSGHATKSRARAPVAEAAAPGPTQALWEVDVSELKSGPKKAWVDFLNDVSSADVRLAAHESFRSVEHLKRYTTMGMAPDQGKTSNINALGILGLSSQRPPQEVGTTRFRPPFNPVTFGAVAGRTLDEFYAPRRRLPAWQRHRELNALMDDYGAWQRPVCYPREGEDEQAAIRREVSATRASVGLFDASPLGKILVKGPDAAELLTRMYVNNMKTLKVGFCRYGLMLDEFGIVADDGVLARLDEETYLVGATSGHADMVTDALEEWLQCEWVDLDVIVEQVTTQWATMTVSGPKAREVLGKVVTEVDLSGDAFPHMTWRDARIGEVPARIMRVSFSGDLSYEVSVPFGYGQSLWDAFMAAGRDFDIVPYGVESLMVMRVEKGYLHLGADTDGMTFPQDVGFGGIIAKKKDDFVGRRSTMTPIGKREDRRQFVGLAPQDGKTLLPIGAHVVGTDYTAPPHPTQGWVTSSVYSPTLERPVALGMVMAGASRIGEEVLVIDDRNKIPARIVESTAYDPSGERLRG